MPMHVLQCHILGIGLDGKQVSKCNQVTLQTVHHLDDDCAILDEVVCVLVIRSEYIILVVYPLKPNLSSRTAHRDISRCHIAMDNQLWNVLQVLNVSQPVCIHGCIYVLHPHMCVIMYECKSWRIYTCRDGVTILCIRLLVCGRIVIVQQQLFYSSTLP